MNEISQLRTELARCLRRGNSQRDNDDDTGILSSRLIDILKKMMSLYTIWVTSSPSSGPDRVAPTSHLKFKVSAAIDSAFRAVTNEAFRPPYRLSWVNLGMEALQLQLHSSDFCYTESLRGNTHREKVTSTIMDEDMVVTQLHPLLRQYGSIPKGTWGKALRALTSNAINLRSLTCSPRSIRLLDNPLAKNSSRHSLSSAANITREEDYLWIAPPDAAFRILQRLVTGHGVRTWSNNQQGQLELDERDFNMVLHAYTTAPRPATAIRMRAVHRVLALQERTPHAPPLGAVAYSILLRAYGRDRDLENVEMCLRHARRNAVVPDLVMANTAVDAYVNCRKLERARRVVQGMTEEAHEDGVGAKTGDLVSPFGVEDRFWSLLRPNSQTYNTLLKGMAEEGDVKSALKLSKLVQSKGLWDDITTNTMVKTAITAKEFDLAESFLAVHTSAAKVHSPRGQMRQHDGNPHPNVEAYTELLDGYAKSNHLEDALRVMRVMHARGVMPNEYTYTCLVGALARKNKVRQARKMIHYAITSLPAPTKLRGNSHGKKRRMAKLAPIYNAFISGLLAESRSPTSDHHLLIRGQVSSHAANIVEVLSALQEMQQYGIQPNAASVALMVDGLGRCNPPRCGEARDLVQRLQQTTFQVNSSATAASSPQQHEGSGVRGTMISDNGERISFSNYKIATSFVSAYGRANNTSAAAEAFRWIAAPDVVALNALLDAHCRNGEIKPALKLFRRHVDFKEWSKHQEKASVTDNVIRKKWSEEKKSQQRHGGKVPCVVIEPDVVTYTTLMVALLSLKSGAATKHASSLYDEMKCTWQISPDIILIDSVLAAIIGHTEPDGLEDDNIRFILAVLRDGARLQWEPGQYEKRTRAVRVLVEVARNGGSWWSKGEEPPKDPLFRKKGWNQIDSGFRMWGRNAHEEWSASSTASADPLLVRKGWNDIDSGWRWI